MNREIPRLIAAAVLGAAIATGLSSTAAEAPKKRPYLDDTCSAVYEVQTEAFAIEGDILRLERNTSEMDKKLDDIGEELKLQRYRR